MRSNYKKLGPYIKEVDIRNAENIKKNLLGVSTQKVFIKSIANTVGTNYRRYKVVKKNQFTYVPDTSRRGDKIGIAMLENLDQALVSQAYTVFKIIDENILNPEYLMMWFRRPEFNRYSRFKSHGSVREIFGWQEMCEVELPIPNIETQREIVAEYNTIKNRMALNNQLIQKLEETAQAIYKQWFVDFDDDQLEYKSLGDLCSLITDGKHGDCKNELDSGYYFVSVKDLINGEIIYDNARQITKIDFEETHRRTDLKAGDILLTNAGTIGRMVIVRNLPETSRTTFQKSVAILKPKDKVTKTNYLYLLLKYHLKDIIELAGGSTQSNLLLSDLRNFEIKYPGFDFVRSIENKTKPIFEMMGSKGLENQKLSNLKDLLLSKMTKVETEKKLFE
jgi:type I restriction enzyme S subunit